MPCMKPMDLYMMYPHPSILDEFFITSSNQIHCNTVYIIEGIENAYNSFKFQLNISAKRKFLNLTVKINLLAYKMQAEFNHEKLI